MTFSRHRRIASFLAALVLFSSTWTVFGRQATPPAFGPVHLLRKTGAPQKFKSTFTATPGAHLVCLFNGGASGQFRRVSSANVRLNGVPIFPQSNFNQNVPTMSRAVSVLARNELTVDLASIPGSGISLWVQPGVSCAGTTTNAAPVITSSPVTTAQPLEPYTYVVDATDADHDPLQFSLTAAPPGMTIDPATGVVAWLPTLLGAIDVTVRVIDGKGGEATQSFALTLVKPANRPPDLVPLANRQVPLGATFKLGLAADDPDIDDVLTFDLLSGPAGASVTPSPMLVWTPDAAQLGPHVVNVRVQDAAGLFDTGSFTIDVVNTNGAPVLAPQPDETTMVGATVARTLTALDPNPGDTLTFALVSGPAGLTVSPGGALAWTPVGTDPGSHQVKVKVTDTAGLNDAGAFTIHVAVAPLPQPPTAVDDEYAARRATTLTVAPAGVLANDINPGGGLLTAQVVTPPSKGTLSLNTDGGFSYAQTPPPANSTQPALKFHYQSELVNNTAGSNRSQSYVADLNKDGVPEIVFITMAQFNVRRLIAVRGDTGAKAWQTDAYQPSATPQIVLSGSGLSIGDLDGDGYLEILAVHSDNETTHLRRKLIAFNHDGTYRWTSDDILDAVNVTQTSGMFRTDLADLDADGIPEILVHHIGKSPLTPAGVVGEDLVTVFNADGHIRWTRRVPTSASQETMAVADIDLDGQPDILVGGAVLDRLGNIKWNIKSTISPLVDVAVANLDNDPFAEIVYLDQHGRVYTYDHTGARKWGPIDDQAGQFSFGQLGIGDTDGDGLPEILLPSLTANTAIEVFDRNGNLVRTMSLPAGLNSQGNGGSVTTFDLNGDGRPEVIYQSQRGSFDPISGQGSLFIFDGPTGALLHETQVSRSSAQDSGPIVADVDGDGSAEIVTSGWSDGKLVSVFQAASGTWAQTRPIWNQHAYHITNVESDGRIPGNETVNWLTPGLNNYRANVPMPAERTGDTDQFTYVASNGAATSNVATVRIDLLPPNTAPRILSLAPTAASPGIDYLYAVRAVDPDVGETLGFSLPMAPNGMVVGGSTGLIQWVPPTGSTGSAMVVVQVTDSQGQTDSQQFTIVLGPPVSVPDVTGQSIGDAEGALESAGLVTGSMASSPSSTVAAGLIISQNPTTASLVATGSAIDLIVSSGPAPVAVPLVVGQSQTAATSALSLAGLGVNVTHVVSNSVPAGLVTAQTPEAGTALVPGSVDITVSAGSGLRLQLARGAMTAGASIPFTVTAYDLNLNDIVTPLLQYAIVEARAPSYGGLPTVSGGLITSSATTRGLFRLTATDPGTGRAVSAEFAVTYPREPDSGPSMAEAYEGMLEAFADIDEVIRVARIEFAAGNTAAYRGLLNQMVQRWKQVDPIALRLATPFGLEQGFFPAPSELPALGLTLTDDDRLAEQVLRDMMTDLQAWTDGLRAPTTPMAQLTALARQFHSRAKRMNSLTLSLAGVIKAQPVITMLLSDRLPAFYSALMSELELVVANAASAPDADGEPMSGPFVGRESTLAEQLTIMAIEYVVEEVADEINPYKKYTGDLYGQAAWAGAVVVVSQMFREAVHGQPLTAVIAGAWLSIRSFDMPDSIIEAAVDTDDPLNNVVITIGPDVFKRIGLDLEAEASSLGGLLATVAKGRDLYQALIKVHQWLLHGDDSAEGVAEIIQDSFQGPSEGLKGCLFTSAQDCGQLVFGNGFNSVYEYNPPDGFQSLTGLPVPILFIVYNRTTGAIFIDIPVFLPTKSEDGGF